jgi:diguanylate cyclase (GGDEF)-like protein
MSTAGIGTTTAGNAWSEALVMMVDDESMLTDVIQSHLEDAGYSRFVACNDPREAQSLIARHRPDVLLLDLMMPGVSGFDILLAIRDNPELQFLPIIVLTAASDPATKLRALEIGATEFLAKPVDASELVLRVRNTLAFKRYQDRLAYEDPVTGLPNRARFTRRVDDLLPAALQRESSLALLHVSCGQFRQTRDTLGSRAADDLLRQAGHRLQEFTRQYHTERDKQRNPAEIVKIARVGDQDFALIVTDLPQADDAALIAKQLMHCFNEPLDVEGHAIFLSPCIGISLAPTDGQHADGLLNSANLACAKALSSNGKTRYEFFSEEFTARSKERLTLTNQLRRAIDNDELRLHYQPKVCLKTGHIIGAEALVRWQHPEHGLLLPGRFIGLAEDSGLIEPLGDWVTQSAIKQAAQWHRAGVGPLKVSINAARPQFEGGTLCPRLKALLAQYALPPDWLMVELTESLLVEDAAKALQQMHDLRNLGIGLSIDDFGTGYSSLSYLKRFPACELKIDRSFIMDLPVHITDRAIVETVITLGRSLGMEVVAEGVETIEQMRCLQQMRCDVFQGFLFSKAVPPEAFETLVRGDSARPLVCPQPGDAVAGASAAQASAMPAIIIG